NNSGTLFFLLGLPLSHLTRDNMKQPKSWCQSRKLRVTILAQVLPVPVKIFSVNMDNTVSSTRVFGTIITFLSQDYRPTADGLPVKVGRVIFKVGDFEGIVGSPGARQAKGFLFPASPVIVGHKVYVTNLALALTSAVGDEPEEEVDLFTVVKVEGIPGL